MLRFHGGGWAAGAPEDDDVLNDQIARGCNVAVVSPEYTLTPAITIRDQIVECVALTEWWLPMRNDDGVHAVCW